MDDKSGNELDHEEMRVKVNREFERRDANQLSVTIECQGKTYEGTLEDISPNGVRLKCDAELPSRGTIKIRVPYPDGDEKYLLNGVLRWTRTITEAGVELTGKQKTYQ